MDDYTKDIDKYLKGELTPAQMHALEKKALTDPFLAEALEGLGTLQANDLATDLRELRSNVGKRVAKHTLGRYWIARIAAGLLLLAISTFLIIFISNRSNTATDNLALNKEENAAPELQVQPLPSTANDSVVEDRFEGKSEAEEGKVVEEQKPVPLKEAAESRSREQPVAQAPAANRDEKADAEIAQSAAEEEKVAEATRSDSPPSVGKSDDIANTKKESDDSDSQLAKRKAASGAAAAERSARYSALRKTIQGKVTFSNDGTALPGVNILVKGTNEGAVTDERGNYQILVTDEQPTLVFSFIGFANKEVEANSDEVNVEMDADISELSEVVVVGYGSKDVDFLPSTPTVMELATPEGGRKVFKQYLEENLRYPEQALENQVEGKVTVQFTIGMTGQVSDFKVIRGLGYGCDEEVIRLIKEGPKWLPTKKNEEPIKDRVRVRMRFSLPKK